MLEEIIEEVKESMDKAIESLRRDLSSIRTGRASAAMLDNVRVDYYGQQTALNQVATISVPEPRLLAIKPWEAALIPVIERAILADKSLGLNPAQRRHPHPAAHSRTDRGAAGGNHQSRPAPSRGGAGRSATCAARRDRPAPASSKGRGHL